MSLIHSCYRSGMLSDYRFFVCVEPVPMLLSTADMRMN